MIFSTFRWHFYELRSWWQLQWLFSLLGLQICYSKVLINVALYLSDSSVRNAESYNWQCHCFLFLKIAKLEGRKCKPEKLFTPEVTGSGRAEDEEPVDCELSLALSLPQPSSHRSDSSSTSEISEAFSSYSRSNFKDCSGFSTGKRDINLDLSIALCGAWSCRRENKKNSMFSRYLHSSFFYILSRC